MAPNFPISQELAVAAAEQLKITLLRLDKLVAELSSSSTGAASQQAAGEDEGEGEGVVEGVG